MIIPITVAPANASERKLPPQFAQYGTDEVVLIELQGSLEVEGEVSGKLVGRLDLTSDAKKPTLLIGHHLLEGKLVNLAKPLAVMERTSSSPKNSEVIQMYDDESAPIDRAPEWHIFAVVKRKMVFSKRPMPMVGKVPGPGAGLE